MYKRELQRRYKDYLIVVAPSASKANVVRGFAPNQAIAMTIHSHVFNGLYKKVDYKQSDQSYTQRAGIRDVIGLRGGAFLKNRKILLLDDVMTSGETIKTCLELIEKEKPQKKCLTVPRSCAIIIIVAAHECWCSSVGRAADL